MVDIFDEVEEELRAERAQRLLKQYAGLIVAAIVLVIAAAGGWEAWNWWHAKQDAKAAQQYLAAMTLQASPSADANRKTLIGDYDAVAKQSPEGYRTLARLQTAALQARSGDMASATALWNQVASDGDADPLLRDLATLLWCQHQIDSGDPGMLSGRLKPLAEAGNPWRPLAEEQLALLDLRQGHKDAAKATLTRLSQDVTAPQGVRGRAAALLGRLG